MPDQPITPDRQALNNIALRGDMKRPDQLTPGYISLIVCADYDRLELLVGKLCRAENAIRALTEQCTGLEVELEHARGGEGKS